LCYHEQWGCYAPKTRRSCANSDGYASVYRNPHANTDIHGNAITIGDTDCYGDSNPNADRYIHTNARANVYT
jgi:hypothetical protein